MKPTTTQPNAVKGTVWQFLPFYMLSLLPIGLLHVLSGFIASMLYHVIKYRRHTVHLNLQNAFTQTHPIPLSRIQKAYYQHMTDVLVETIKLLSISRRKMLSKLQLTNPELLDQLYAQQKNIILYTCHQGNWEWLAALPLYTDYKVCAIYQPLSNAYFNTLMHRVRSRFGIECIPSNKATRRIACSQNHDKPHLFIIIGDQCPQQHSTKYWSTFLNQETAFYNGTARLTLKYKLTPVYAFINKQKRGSYKIHLLNIVGTSIDGITKSYIKHLENSIRLSPTTWLWSHRRWKLKKHAS